ncbi:MAG: MJ1477/TM1410 family putative glycoside hydrolase [candidate division WOR-3 bacterium]
MSRRLLLVLSGLIISACCCRIESGQQKFNDYLIQLQNVDLEAIGNTRFDLVIIDYSRDGSEEGRFSPDAIRALKTSPGGSKLVIAYLSIGEAESYRWYWDSLWDADRDGHPDPGAPSWLGDANPDWPDNYKVRYWEQGWQEIIYFYLDRIIDAGFDGVLLDVVDAYEYWGPEGESGAEFAPAASEMVRFVSGIASYTRQVRGRSDFLVIPNGGEGLGEFDEYRTVVSAILREDVWYYDNSPQPPEATAEVIDRLNRFHSEGKPVLVLDYVTEPVLIDDFYFRAGAAGFIPYATVRELDRLTINPGHEPD